MIIRFLSCFSVAGITFFLSLPVMAQSSTKPESVDLTTPRTSEIITEDTSPTESKKPTEINNTSNTKPGSVDSTTPRTSEIMIEDTSPTDSKKPTEINNTSKTPESNPSTSEVNPENNTSVEELTNTTEEIKKDGAETVETQSGEQNRPTIKTPSTLTPMELKK